jgi:hypothetical protein
MGRVLKHLEAGQTLLEIVVMIGVILVIVSGLTITVVNGLKNSQLSQNQAQATKLAQEGIEKVKTIKANNWNVCSKVSEILFLVTWADIWTTGPMGSRSTNTCRAVTGVGANSTCSFKLNSDSVPPPTSVPCNTILGGSIPNTPIWLTSTSEISPGPEIIKETPFTRLIYIEDYDDGTGNANLPNLKRVTSQVKWTDYSGEHVTNLSTIIANY